MKQTLLFLVLLFSSLSCQMLDTVNAVENDNNNSAFLEQAKAAPIPKCIKQKIKEFKKDFKGCEFCFVESAEFKGQTVYVFDEGSAFDAPVSVYDKNCELLGSWGGRRFSEFRAEFDEKATNKKRLWH
jgi:hypothetical protein